MASPNHKKWVTAKKTLSESTLKTLKQNKRDLGPNLDKFEQARAAIEKEFSYGEPGKVVSKLIDTLKKTSEAVSSAADDYAYYLKVDKDAGKVLKTLLAIKKDVVDNYQKLAKEYAKVRQH